MESSLILGTTPSPQIKGTHLSPPDAVFICVSFSCLCLFPQEWSVDPWHKLCLVRACLPRSKTQVSDTKHGLGVLGMQCWWRLWQGGGGVWCGWGWEQASRGQTTKRGSMVAAHRAGNVEESERGWHTCPTWRMSNASQTVMYPLGPYPSNQIHNMNVSVLSTKRRNETILS
jgi:hypothetical protein